MSRVFLMKWYHFSVEYFEDLRNVNHCEFLIMRKKEDSGKYILENNLRTWSELKRERLLALKEKEKNNPSSAVSEKDKEKEKKLEKLDASAKTTDVPIRKKWGGCPNGCDHGKHSYRKENSMHAMQLNGKPSPSSSPVTGPPENLPFRRAATAPSRRWQSSSEEDEDDPRGRAGPPAQLDIQRSLDEVISSPDGTPSFISVEDRLRTRLKSPKQKNSLLSPGRDFGGSTSGVGSDTEFSQEEDARKRLAKGLGIAGRKKVKESGMGRGALADALGDQSDVGSDAGSEFEDLSKAEKEDKSVRGSVY
jgi:hypothetical protein